MSRLSTFYINVPETFLVSASRANSPDSDNDGTASLSFTHGQLRPMGVPSEEGPAGVAGDPAVVKAGPVQLLLTDLTHDAVLRLRHLAGEEELEIFIFCQFLSL